MARTIKRRRAEPTMLGSFLEGALPSSAPDDAQLLRVLVWWSKHVPVRIVKNARPVKLSRGSLFVHTTSSTWAGELSFQADQWLARLRMALPDIPIRSLRVQVGPLPNIDLPRPLDADDLKSPVRPLTRLPEDLARDLTRIADDELRDAISAAMKIGLGSRGPQKK